MIAQRGERAERVFSSVGLCALTGWTAEELAAMPATSLAAPSEQARMVELRETILRGGPLPTQVETAIRARSGEINPVEISVASVRGPAGLSSVLFFRDLGAVNHMQDALRDSEARFRSLADASPDAVAVLVRDRFLYANPTTAALLGYDSAAELLARPFEALLTDPVERAAMAGRLDRITQGERVPPREYAVRRKDGSLATLEATTTPITYHGTPAFLSIGRDTSERRALHAELMRADRLASLGMLAAGVAHEINNR